MHALSRPGLVKINLICALGRSVILGLLIGTRRMHVVALATEVDIRLALGDRHVFDS